MTVCKNCAREFEGKFCPKCGQKSKTGRITLKQVFNDARQHFIHFDQGFLYTMKELLVRPGHTIREYIEGKRVRHIKPVKFMFWASAISFLVFHFMGLDQQMIEKMADQQANSPIGQQLSQKLFQVFIDHPAVMMFCMIPLIALWSWLLFRRRGYNFAEHFVLNTFLMGELSLATIATSPVSRYLNDISTTTTPMTLFSIGIWVVYFGWAYLQFFQQGGKIGIVLKGALAILLGYLFMIIVVAILTVIVIVFFKSQLEAWLMQG